MAGGSPDVPARRLLLFLCSSVWLLALATGSRPQAANQAEKRSPAREALHFETSDSCLACHNSLIAPSGEDVSIGASWRGSMMANSSRDPYWQASVRRETIDHASAAREIEDECSICHMPMARTLAHGAGRHGEIFARLPVGARDDEEDRLAADGVSCMLCHQISSDRLGSRDSFTGGYVIKPVPMAEGPGMFGPFTIDAGRTSVMHSATGVKPAESAHVSQSELCATCHTLYTNALTAGGQRAGSLPEQVPYLEWRHSAFQQERSCQSCHMPEVAEPTPVSSVLGEPREGFSRHSFIGGNFFMLRMLNRYRRELGVRALASELETSSRATLAQLQSETAVVTIAGAAMSGGQLTVDVAVRNLTGHKLPTGYPSRRVWLHVTVRDRSGRMLFESGGVAPSGAIQGNDNDADPTRYEPHRDVIRAADEVQIYESVMVDSSGVPTTGLLFGTRFVKDNRLLPRGFDKKTAEADIAVAGEAAGDTNFDADGDRVRYVADVSAASGPLHVEVELRYQPIAYRWAQNLNRYDAPEPRRFVSYYDSMAAQSSTVLSRAAATVE